MRKDLSVENSLFNDEFSINYFKKILMYRIIQPIPRPPKISYLNQPENQETFIEKKKEQRKLASYIVLELCFS